MPASMRRVPWLPTPTATLARAGPSPRRVKIWMTPAMAFEPYTAAAGPRNTSMRSTCDSEIDSHGAPPVDCESTRTPSM